MEHRTDSLSLNIAKFSCVIRVATLGIIGNVRILKTTIYGAFSEGCQC